MTPLEALEIQEQRLRAIVELAPACLARVTRDGTVLAMNGASRNMLGASEARDVLKKSLLTFAGADDRERLRALVEQGCDGKAASLELSMIGLSGDVREIEACVVALPARGDAAPTALLTFRDISGYRRLEDSVIETARAEAEKAAREAVDRARELELSRVRGEADTAAHIANALREAALRDAARLEELDAQVIELEEQCRQLAGERDAQVAAIAAARTDAQAADRDRDELHRRLDERATDAESARAQLARELDDRRSDIARLHEQIAQQREEISQQREAIERLQRETGPRQEHLGRLQDEAERGHEEVRQLRAEIARLQAAHLAHERADAERAEQTHAVEEQRRDTADSDRLVAALDELKRTLDSTRAAHATEMAIAFADRAALERRVLDTEIKQRRIDADVARLTVERDGAVRALAESQQHEQRARRWIAHWLELERAMQSARADLQELADWVHGRHGHNGKNGHPPDDEAPIARPLSAAPVHPTNGDASWS